MKKITNLLLMCFLLTVIISTNSSCKKTPGPIEVNNSITPSTVNNGSSIQWNIIVTNKGGEVQIDKIHVREEFISGWAQGQSAEMDLPVSGLTINDNETQNVYSKSVNVYNTGDSDIQVKNTVTVYSNGGVSTDVAIYTILEGKKKSADYRFKTLIQ